MVYTTYNGYRATDSDVFLAKILANRYNGRKALIMPTEEFKRICICKGRLSNPDYEFEDEEIMSYVYNNDPLRVVENSPTCFSRKIRFLRAMELFFEKEDMIAGDMNSPRYFNLGDSYFSDSELLISYEIISGKRKKSIDEEVQHYLDKCEGIEELDQSQIDFPFLISRGDCFRAVKYRIKKGEDKIEAITKVADRFF